MALAFKSPGVKIIEVQSPGPIEGVGTSTAAFVGPALAGDLFKPTKVVNWTQFANTFGLAKAGQPVNDPYKASPRIYMPHAVRGFFDNGGTVCYIVRVGTAQKSSRLLADRDGGNALLVSAKQDGVGGDSITIQVDDAHIQSTTVSRHNANIAGGASDTHITLDDASTFRVGERVLLDDGGGTTDTAVISSINTGTNEVTFAAAVSKTYTAGTIRTADLVAGQTEIYVEDTVGIELGSIIQVANAANDEMIAVVGVAAAATPAGNPRPGRLTLAAPGLANGYDMSADVAVETQEFTLTVTNGTDVETFENLSMEPGHSRYFADVVDSDHVTVELPDPPSTAAPPENLPAVIAASPLQNGANDDLNSINEPLYQQGIDALERIDDVNMLCVPDAANGIIDIVTVQNAMIAHCTNMEDRFAILDPGPGLEALTGNTVLDQRNSISGSPRGFAALYYPQIIIPNPNPAVGGTVKIPPSGHIAGIYARSDASRGVHKAPANEPIQGVLALEQILTDAEQGELNINQVNVLRNFPGLGPTVWGARTISTETAWRYVSTRRLFLFLEESLQEGTRWAVFEPNDLALWGKLKRVVTGFLTRTWQSGALFGATPEEAFYVKVDEELNPPEVRQLGQVIIEVGVLPAFPAEFVIFRIGQKAGGADVTELG